MEKTTSKHGRIIRSQELLLRNKARTFKLSSGQGSPVKTRSHKFFNPSSESSKRMKNPDRSNSARRRDRRPGFQEQTPNEPANKNQYEKGGRVHSNI